MGFWKMQQTILTSSSVNYLSWYSMVMIGIYWYCVIRRKKDFAHSRHSFLAGEARSDVRIQAWQASGLLLSGIEIEIDFPRKSLEGCRAKMSQIRALFRFSVSNFRINKLIGGKPAVRAYSSASSSDVGAGVPYERTLKVSAVITMHQCSRQ